MKPFFLILFYIGFAFKINFIGQISYAELFLLGVSPFILFQIDWKNSEQKQLSLLYLALLLIQVLSEVLIGNTITNSLRGISVTIVSFLHVMFLFQFLKTRFDLIPLLILAQAISMVVAGNPLVEEGETMLLEEAGAMKMYTGPIITFILLFLTARVQEQKSIFFLLIAGLSFIFLGARSQGAMVILASLGVFFKMVYIKRFSWITLWKLMIPVIAVIYVLYCVYVAAVLSGSISAGNNVQITKVDNPYNPLNILMFGRTEVFVGMIAVLDSLWIGHGAWAVDQTGKYTLLQASLHGDNVHLLSLSPEIPSHSVVIGYGVYNGVVALLISGAIILFFLKRGIIALIRKSDFTIILSYSLIYIVWHGLFSPHSAFRITLPIFFVTCWLSYYNTSVRKKI